MPGKWRQCLAEPVELTIDIGRRPYGDAPSPTVKMAPWGIVTIESSVIVIDPTGPDLPETSCPGRSDKDSG
jgi:hypothetical protein